jgi:hypothetical protein
MSFDTLVADAEKHKWLVIGIGGGLLGLLILLHGSSSNAVPSAPLPVSEDPTAVAGRVAITQANDALKAQQDAAQAAIATTNSTNRVAALGVTKGAAVSQAQTAAALRYGLNTNAVGANIAGDTNSTQLQALQLQIAQQEADQASGQNFTLQNNSANAQYGINSQDSGQSFEQEIYNALFLNQRNLASQGYAYDNAALQAGEVNNASNNQAYEYGIGQQGYINSGTSALGSIASIFGGFL